MNKPVREGFVEDKPVDIEDMASEESAPAPAPPKPDEFPMVIKLLHKPIRKSPTEDLQELTFREPSAADIMRCGGNPCRMELVDVGDGTAIYRIAIDDRKMLTLIANLSGVHEPMLQRMDPRDYNSCAYRLQRFFIPEQGTW